MTQEKKRGPKPKPLQPWRPQLRLDADTLAAAQRLGMDAMSEIVTWVIPRWNERSHPAAQDVQESRVVLRPLGAEGREPVQVHFDPALRATGRVTLIDDCPIEHRIHEALARKESACGAFLRELNAGRVYDTQEELLRGL